jgi:hypothetical protein
MVRPSTMFKAGEGGKVPWRLKWQSPSEAEEEHVERCLYGVLLVFEIGDFMSKLTRRNCCDVLDEHRVALVINPEYRGETWEQLPVFLW